MEKKSPIGDRLWIQMADFRHKKSVMMIPLNMDHIAIDGTPWVEGTCIPGMGKVLAECLIFWSISNIE